MNYFEDFAKEAASFNIALYLGALVVAYVLFKDKLEPVKKYLQGLFQKAVEKTEEITSPSVSLEEIRDDDSKVFFDLVKSWKQTRDLAEDYGATKAVEIADQMFPYLVPTEDLKDE